jgi:hypothetical protein
VAAGRSSRPPATATIGTPAHGAKGALLAQLREPGTVFMMGDNPALPRMPERPSLGDFFRLRFDPFSASHLLQSAKMARERGLGEKAVTACLLHDIPVAGLVSSDHGYWGAQMVAPYVDEEVAWRTRAAGPTCSSWPAGASPPAWTWRPGRRSSSARCGRRPAWPTSAALPSPPSAREGVTRSCPDSRRGNREDPIDAVLDDDAVQRMRDAGMVSVPTLTMMECVAQLRAAMGLRYEHARDTVTKFHQAGVPVLAGTEANSGTGVPASPRHGESMHHELELLVAAGLSPAEALRGATAAVAEIFGLRDRGVIAPGKRADLLLVDGDPTVDITATRNISAVWIAGERVK